MMNRFQLDEDELLAKALQEEINQAEDGRQSQDHEQSHLQLFQDELLARQLQEEFGSEESLERHEEFNKSGILDPVLQKRLPFNEFLDPNPDLHQLFMTFNAQYFWGKLDGVEVRWSSKMTIETFTFSKKYEKRLKSRTYLIFAHITNVVGYASLCAGMCYYFRGGYCSVRLSEPLLKYRPREDMINTLLHEMIHAYLFVTANNRDRDGHGPEFHKHMHRINKATGSKITVFHNFHDEVNHYRVHVWKCNGPCRNRPPYFGIVRRSMNRPPQPADRWWSEHQQTCGGVYTKIAGPDLSKIKKENNKGDSDTETKKRSLLGKKKTAITSARSVVTAPNRTISSNNSDQAQAKKKPKTLVEIFDKMKEESTKNKLCETPKGLPPRHLIISPIPDSKLPLMESNHNGNYSSSLESIIDLTKDNE